MSGVANSNLFYATTVLSFSGWRNILSTQYAMSAYMHGDTRDHGHLTATVCPSGGAHHGHSSTNQQL